MSTKKDYWNEYWNSITMNKGGNLHNDVGRTINGVPIDKESWNKTLDYITNIMDIKLEDIVLDVCAGNGIISKELSKKCSQVTAVDFSKRLLNKIDVSRFKNIQVALKDVRKLDFESNSFDKIIFYFSVQHFTKSEVVVLFRKFYDWLKPGGILFIGDIPDSSRIWNFFNSEERRKIYFKSLESESPVIGTWFNRVFFEYLSLSMGFEEFNSIDQPKYQINSHYRFDFLSKK